MFHITRFLVPCLIFVIAIGVAASGAPPIINSFTVSDANPVYGKSITLNWKVTNSTSQSINQNIGNVTATGAVNIVPLSTTTYTLTAANASGSTTATAAVTLPTPVGVSSDGFTVRRVSSTVAFPFTGMSYLQSALAVLSGQNAGAATTLSGYTAINFASGSDGDYTSGNQAFPGGGGTNFAVQITGTLVVNSPGEYNFIINSDDGCRLRIDGKDVIVNDATHNPDASSGKIILSKPSVTFELIYYNAGGGGEVELSWIKPDLTWQLAGVAAPVGPIVRGSVLISEFCASNDSTIVDEDGASSDWIEIWNSTSNPVDLAGYYLGASAAAPAQWAFPSKILAPNEYLIVFASGKNRANPASALHTNFTLPASGGYLSLKKADGSGGYTVLSEFTGYPAQSADVSYGSSDAEGYIGFMEAPTPGAPNAATYAGFVQPVAFSQARGRFAAPFNLTLTTSTPGAEIRYTTDGSAPGFNHGAIYTAPLPINSTSTIRAAAFIAGWKPSVATTNSYIFVDDVVNQTSAYTVGRGWPSSSVNGQVYRYGMDLASVTSGGGAVGSLKSALSAAPSVCLNMNPDEFYGAANGIYSNPQNRGRYWEREASIEVINADGSSAFQKDCGVRIRGNVSRNPAIPKHAFHLYFRNLYAGDLIYPLFGAEGSITRFDQIDMRCEQSNSWQVVSALNNNAQNTLIREQWTRKTQGDQGQPYSRGSYFHLYINGIYWGVFNWEERTEGDFAANQFGGEDFDYDTLKSAGNTDSFNTEVSDGDDIAWKALFDLCIAVKNETTDTGRDAIYLKMMGLNRDGTRNLAYPVYLDADNLIDYMLTIFYSGSFDGPLSTFVGNASNNWFAFRKRDGGTGGFKFFAHDLEHGMGSGAESYNRVGPWGNPNASTNNWGQTQYKSRGNYIKFNPQYLHEYLCYSPEYRRRFSDRVERNCFGSGALTTAAALTREAALAAQVDPIIHAEAARWGSASLNRNTWLSAVAGVESFINTGGAPASGQTSWATQFRSSLLIEQLKGYTDNGAKPLYIAISPPVFSGATSGIVNPPYTVQISNPNASGIIYYTTDGSDPRSIGGGISSSAQNGASPLSITLTNSATIRARIYSTSLQNWSASTEASYLAGVLGSAGNLVISKLHYRPASSVINGEFLEIMNISSTNVVLTNCRFTTGVTYSFPENYLIPPGGRCLIVESVADFMAGNPAVTASIIAGQYSGSLSNSGERLVFLDSSGAVIKDFSYGTAAPWPLSPNGGGPCLVLIKPETNPPHGVATNWRASVAAGGAPGLPDGVRLAAWLTGYGISDLSGLGDADKDGLPDFLEYALGLEPTHSNTDGTTFGISAVSGVGYLTLTVTHPLGRDDVAGIQGEASINLTSWEPAVLLSAIANGDGSETLVYRHPNAISSDTKQFLRLKVSK